MERGYLVFSIACGSWQTYFLRYVRHKWSRPLLLLSLFLSPWRVTYVEIYDEYIDILRLPWALAFLLARITDRIRLRRHQVRQISVYRPLLLGKFVQFIAMEHCSDALPGCLVLTDRQLVVPALKSHGYAVAER